jgi:PPM family protein phosphatase
VLRVVEEAARTDTGRQRAANEDAYFARSPVYAVADGMGGARAGEVAAQIAAEAFEREFPGGINPERELAAIASEANRRIYELASSDSSRSGMGTTLTGAFVSDDEVSIVHVGDSRAYLFREGQLRQLTRDHSLVEELRRRGQLTVEEAEEHPQRSIITRALGPEAQVEVDVHSHQAKSGDVFLLCSDGLTSMVREERLHEILAEGESLRTAVDGLVEEANRMGGRDNITVVLFRVVDTDEKARAAETSEQTAADLDSRAVQARVESAAAEAAERAGAARPRARKGIRRLLRAARPARRVRRPGRLLLIGLISLVAVGGLTAGAVAGIRSVYFVGQDRRGLITLYRGLPYELPAGIKLYQSEYVSSVQARTLRPFERRRLLDHELRSRGDAGNLILKLERGR